MGYVKKGRFAVAGLIACVLLAAAGAHAQGADRVYVRRIELEGVAGTADEVLRRELLQLEGTYLNVVALEQSRLRLERLPFVDGVEVAVRPVPGAPDVVDIVLHVREAPWRRYGGGGAYSESFGASAHGYFVNENVFGTGRRLSAELEASEYRSRTGFSLTNPYARSVGVSRTVALVTRDIERLSDNASPLDAELASARLEYGYRSGEAGRVTFGLDLRRAELAAPIGASTQLLEWIARNGDPAAGSAIRVDELNLGFRWRFDTRDSTVFPTRGLDQTLEILAAAPGSDLDYYLAEYRLAKRWAVGARWSIGVGIRAAYGAAYGGDTFSIPPYARWLAGGPATLRGFRENSLGPRDSLGNPYGGNALLTARFEAMTPWPERWRNRVRAGMFIDAGNAFSTDDLRFGDDAGRVLDYGFDASDLRYSAGLAAEVLIPLGTLRLSYGVPFDSDERNSNRFLRDEVEHLQLAFGVEF